MRKKTICFFLFSTLWQFIKQYFRMNDSNVIQHKTNLLHYLFHFQPTYRQVCMPFQKDARDWGENQPYYTPICKASYKRLKLKFSQTTYIPVICPLPSKHFTATHLFFLRWMYSLPHINFTIRTFIVGWYLKNSSNKYRGILRLQNNSD